MLEKFGLIRRDKVARTGRPDADPSRRGFLIDAAAATAAAMFVIRGSRRRKSSDAFFGRSAPSNSFAVIGGTYAGYDDRFGEDTILIDLQEGTRATVLFWNQVPYDTSISQKPTNVESRIASLKKGDQIQVVVPIGEDPRYRKRVEVFNSDELKRDPDNPRGGFDQIIKVNAQNWKNPVHHTETEGFYVHADVTDINVTTTRPRRIRIPF